MTLGPGAEGGAGDAASLQGRRALVTGGSRGIGRAVVEWLAAAGASVTAVARSVEPLDQLEADASRHGWDVTTVRCDVTDDEALTRVVSEVGHLDVVVANAGLARSAPLSRTTRDDLDEHLRVNAGAVFSLLRATVPAMRDRGFGRAVVVASTAGVIGAPYTSAYTASKHAAVGLVRAAASEVRGTGVTVNAVCPTFVDTPMTRVTIERIAERTGRTLDEARRALLEQVPLGRLVDADEVAAAVAYLCSDAAAPINGQTLILDGGGTTS